MSLATDYRPRSLKAVIGNQKAIDKINALFSKDREAIPHAILLTGPTGCGKTTMARIIASMLGCKGMDYTEVDQAAFRGIDSIREIRLQAACKPMESSCRVWLMDECHKLTNDAQNAFLKALEEPPAHVYYILATTDPGKLIATLKGRCVVIDVALLKDDEMMQLLQRICKKTETELPQDILETIVDRAAGHPRNALQMLEVLIGANTEDLASLLESTNQEEQEGITLCRALMNPKTPWKDIGAIIAGLEQDPEGVRRQVLGYCQAILLKGDNSRAYLVMDAFRPPLWDIGKPGLTLACYEAMHA